jgi:hypothetical protein
MRMEYLKQQILCTQDTLATTKRSLDYLHKQYDLRE